MKRCPGLPLDHSTVGTGLQKRVGRERGDAQRSDNMVRHWMGCCRKSPVPCQLATKPPQTDSHGTSMMSSHRFQVHKVYKCQLVIGWGWVPLRSHPLHL